MFNLLGKEITGNEIVLVLVDWNLLSLPAQNVLNLVLVLFGELSHGLCKGNDADGSGGSEGGSCKDCSQVHRIAGIFRCFCFPKRSSGVVSRRSAIFCRVEMLGLRPLAPSAIQRLTVTSLTPNRAARSRWVIPLLFSSASMMPNYHAGIKLGISWSLNRFCWWSWSMRALVAWFSISPVRM